MNGHDWIPSTLGHGETMCSRCKITNREAAVLGELNECPKAVTPAPSPAVEGLEKVIADAREVARMAANPSDNIADITYETVGRSLVAALTKAEGAGGGEERASVADGYRAGLDAAAKICVENGDETSAAEIRDLTLDLPATPAREGEVERLRKALEEIAAWEPSPDEEKDPYQQIAGHARRAARAALKGEG